MKNQITKTIQTAILALGVLGFSQISRALTFEQCYQICNNTANQMLEDGHLTPTEHAQYVTFNGQQLEDQATYFALPGGGDVGPCQ